MKFPFQKTDCGRAQSGLRERGDCSVRAVAACLGISYLEAHARLAALGRKQRGGIVFRDIAARLGLEQRPDLSCRTLASILPEMQTGRFIVRKARHVFAVVNGVTMDRFMPAPGSRIQMAYEYSPLPPSP